MKKKNILLFCIGLLCANMLYAQHPILQKINEEGPVVVAHRAAPYLGFTENSLAAMTMAAQSGIWLQEIDLMESKDGKLYLLHDQTLDRTTTHEGPISAYSSADLEKVRLLGTDEKLPDFASVLQHAKAKGITLMLDVKKAPLAKVMAEVQEHGMMQQVMLLTFSKERAQEAISLKLPFVLSVLINEEGDIGHYRQAAQGQVLVAYVSQNAPVNLFQDVRTIGLPILTDVLNEVDSTAEKLGKEHYTGFLSVRNPDMVVTDYPLKLLPLLQSSSFLP
jgi:glycerophosphoryl diester phosphodiesterase